MYINFVAPVGRGGGSGPLAAVIDADTGAFVSLSALASAPGASSPGALAGGAPAAGGGAAFVGPFDFAGGGISDGPVGASVVPWSYEYAADVEVPAAPSRCPGVARFSPGWPDAERTIRKPCCSRSGGSAVSHPLLLVGLVIGATVLLTSNRGKR